MGGDIWRALCFSACDSKYFSKSDKKKSKKSTKKHPSYGAGHTCIQSDMAIFFLRMRLLASPFGLAIN